MRQGESDMFGWIAAACFTFANILYMRHLELKIKDVHALSDLALKKTEESKNES
jgi:hypothetical protein